MLNRDLLKIERDAVRQATGVLTAANDATESNEQRDTRAHELLADIVDSIPEGSRLDDNSFEAVIQAGINDLYYLGPIEELLPDTRSRKSWSTPRTTSGSSERACYGRSR